MKIHVEQSPLRDSTKIYIVDEHNGARSFISFDPESGGLIATASTGNGEEIPVFFEMNNRSFDDFVKGILEYANDKGIKLESESVLSAKLAATEKHLEDIRSYFGDSLKHILKK